MCRHSDHQCAVMSDCMDFSSCPIVHPIARAGRVVVNAFRDDTNTLPCRNRASLITIALPITENDHPRVISFTGKPIAKSPSETETEEEIQQRRMIIHECLMKATENKHMDHHKLLIDSAKSRQTKRDQKEKVEPPETEEDNECVVCLESKKEYAVVPCGHLCLCEGCIPNLKECPICRGEMITAMKIYHT